MKLRDMELRNICFIRHAKSSWDSPHLSDIERPLNHRGLFDAPFMAKKMKELHIVPDLIVTSPANRAQTTARYFADEFDLPDRDFMIEDEIYGAGPSDIIEIVHRLPDDKFSVFLFGHNPTITMLTNMFAGVDVDNVPTCGISQAKTMVDSWSKFSPNTSAFVSFYYPKQYK
jgi:phosphohistidine phosphatase